MDKARLPKTPRRQFVGVRRVLDWLEDGRPQSQSPTEDEILARLEARRRDAADGTLIAARLRTGRAATQTHPNAPLRIELRYLAHGECKVVAAPETKQQIKWEADRVEKYDQAARGIAQGRFPAKPASGDGCLPDFRYQADRERKGPLRQTAAL